MQTIEIKLYKFDELSADAKEKAREWFRKGVLDYEWWDFIYEDAERIGLRLKSFDCDRHEIDGDLMDTVNGMCRRIIAEHGKSCGTYRLAKGIDRRKHNDDDETVRDFQHALLQEYLSMLRAEVDYRLSNEVVDEDIRCNEYEFMEDGKRA